MPIQSASQTGSSASVYQPAVSQQEGSCNHRKVQHRPSEPNRVSGFQNSGAPSDTSLLSRKAEPVKVSHKGFLSAVSKVASPLVEKGMTFSSQRHLKKVKGENAALQKELSGINKKTASLKREIHKLEKKLEQIRTDRRDMSPARLQEYSELQTKTAMKKEKLDTLTQRKPQVAGQLEGMKEQVKLAEMQANLQEEHAGSMRSGMAAGSKLLGGLRKVYQETREQGFQGKGFELDLGNLRVSENGRTELSAKDMKVVISEFSQHSDGSLTLALDECTASDVVVGNQSLGPVKLSGARITVDPPLSDQLSELMTCGFHKLPSKMLALSREYEKLGEQADSINKTMETLGVKELSVQSLEMDGKVISDSSQGAEQLMALLESLVPGYFPTSP
ncbi:MAG: hypothetical protein ACR2PX_07180 [Endozoicomonas sp.]